MIAYMPEIYPDELVYSWFCRWFVHAGCLTHKMAAASLYQERYHVPSKEFVGSLRPETRARIADKYPMEKLVLQHTMFPQYARFCPADKKKDALHHIAHTSRDAHHLLSMPKRSAAELFLQFCPICAAHDREQLGETYWHRSHQIRNIQVCPDHGCKLLQSAVSSVNDPHALFCPAERGIDLSNECVEADVDSVRFARYLHEVFHAPIQIERETPFRAVLYRAMNRAGYVSSTGKCRHTQRLTEDVAGMCQRLGISSPPDMTHIQRVLLGERCDFSVITILAFFLGVRVEELVSPAVSEDEVNSEAATHYVRDSEAVDWHALDAQYLPVIREFAKRTYSGAARADGRPERVSERMVYKELNLKKHQLENLPLCREALLKYSETYPESWARKIVWAYEQLSSKGERFFWSDIRELSGVKKHNLPQALPYLARYMDASKIAQIVQMIDKPAEA